MRAWYRLLFRKRLNYIDFHPGNFLFRDDGQLGLIDFGCVRELTDSEWNFTRLGDWIMQTGGRAEIAAFVRDWCQIGDEPGQDEWIRLGTEYTEIVWAGRLQKGPWDLANPEPLRRAVSIFGELTRKRYTRAQRVTSLYSRQTLCSMALFHRLGARFDVHPIRDEEVQATDWDHV